MASRRGSRQLRPDFAGTRFTQDPFADIGQEAYAILEQLEESRREVFVLAELEEYTAPEIAQILGIGLNTVYSRLRTARKEFDEAVARRRAREGGSWK